MKQDFKVIAGMALFIGMWKGFEMLYWAIPNWIHKKYWAYYSEDVYNWHLSQSYQHIAQYGIVILFILIAFYIFWKIKD